MTINLQTGGYVSPQPLPGTRGADVQFRSQQEKTTPTTDTPIPVLGGSSENTDVPLEQKRYEKVTQAAQHVAQDVYAVSDKNFTIYKDASGQYITRYKSLRDGRVTYIPEPQLLFMFESQSAVQASALKLQV